MVFLLIGILAAHASDWTPQVATHQVYATITDKELMPITGLTVQDFIVQAGGADTAVRDVRRASDPISIVIVPDGLAGIDASRARAAFTKIVSAVRGQHAQSRIAILVGEGPTTPVFAEAGSGAAEIARQIASYYDSGHSAPVLESVQVAARAIAAEKTTRHIVFVISDNTVSSSADHKPGIEALRRANAELWVLTTSRVVNDSPLDNAILTLGPKPSGGRTLNIYTETIDLAAKRLIDLALSAYVVTYETDKIDGALRVGVRLTGASVAAPGWIAK
jgi:hypothetical protein